MTTGEDRVGVENNPRQPERINSALPLCNSVAFAVELLKSYRKFAHVPLTSRRERLFAENNFDGFDRFPIRG